MPDDRIHGDDFGDAWLRPTLTAEATGDAGRGSTAPERPVPSSPQRPSSRPYWLVAGLGATLVLSSVAGVLSWSSLTGGISRTAVEQQSYSRAVSALTIKGGPNDVEVRGGGPSGTVEVARHLSWGPGGSRPTPQEVWSGDQLSIDASCDSGVLSWCSIDYVVTVPDATKVVVDNGSGDVTLTGALGSVDVGIGSGDLDATALRATDLHGQTGSGDIDVTFAAAPSDVRLKTGSGDVTVTLPSDRAYATTVHTGSGDEDVSVRTDPTSANRVAVETGSGDAEIRNP